MSKNEIALNILLSMIDHNQFYGASDNESDLDAAKRFAKMYNAIYETLCIDR